MNEQRKFRLWLSQLYKLMYANGYIKANQKLSAKGYKPYFDEGYKPSQVLREEFGENWQQRGFGYTDEEWQHMAEASLKEFWEDEY